MKKINQFALIIIILVSLFGLAIKAQADDPVGYCTYVNGTTVSGYTEAQCSSMAPGGSWVVGTPSSPAFPSSPATTCTSTGLALLICNAQQLLNSIIPILILLGLVYFIWGVIQYVIADGEEAKKKGRDRIIYGIIGLTVIVSIWGLVNIVIKTFDLGGAVAPTLAPIGGSSTCTAITSTSKFQDYLSYITCVINNSIIPLIFAVALVMFVWGTVKFFIINADEEAKREQGKQYMIWGIIALAVMFSIWGLIAILGGTFGLNTHILPGVQPPG